VIGLFVKDISAISMPFSAVIVKISTLQAVGAIGVGGRGCRLGCSILFDKSIGDGKP